MFYNYSRVLKIPIELAVLRKITPISTGVASKIITSNGILSHRNYSTESKNGMLRVPEYKYLYYSLLCGAAAYTSYKLWYDFWFYHKLIYIVFYQRVRSDTYLTTDKTKNVHDIKLRWVITKWHLMPIMPWLRYYLCTF